MAVATNAAGLAIARRVVARVEALVHPPPDRSTVATVVVTQRPTATPTPPQPPIPHQGRVTPTPSPTPAPVPVDVNLVTDAAAVFHSEITNSYRAAAGTQIVPTILGLGMRQMPSRWSSTTASANGSPGPQP